MIKKTWSRCMADNGNSNNRTSVINSVKTPLGFFTLLALILDAVLLGESVLTARIPLWAPIALLGFLIVCVFAIVMIKPLALYHPSDWPVSEKRMKAKLKFPVQPIEVDLFIEGCILMIRDQNGRMKPEVTPNLVFDHGGWSVLLPKDVVETDSVQLTLIEGEKDTETGKVKVRRQWKVKPFPPYQTDVEAVQTPLTSEIR
jgi:hypothetical protein